MCGPAYNQLCLGPRTGSSYAMMSDCHSLVSLAACSRILPRSCLPYHH